MSKLIEQFHIKIKEDYDKSLQHMKDSLSDVQKEIVINWLNQLKIKTHLEQGEEVKRFMYRVNRRTAEELRK